MPEILTTSFRVSYHRSIEAQSIQKLVTLTTAQVQHAARNLKIAYALDTRHKNTKSLQQTIQRPTQYQML